VNNSRNLMLKITAFLPEKEKERKRLVDFNKKLKVMNFDKDLFDVGLNASIAGTAFLLVYTEMGDTFPRYASLDPELTNVLYDTNVKSNPILAFTLVEQKEEVFGVQQTYYKIYAYTDTMFYQFRTKSTSELTVFAEVGSVEMSDASTYAVPHNMKGVPVIEFKNNHLLYGDARPVYKLIDVYNQIQNDRAKNVDDQVQYVLMLKNVRVGNEEEQATFTTMLKNERVLAIEGQDVDAKFLTNPLDQSQTQVLLRSIEQDIETLSRVPNFGSSEFAQNSSEPALKLKLKGFLGLAQEKERYFTDGLMKVLDITLDFLQRLGGREYTKYYFDLTETEIEYSHALPSNDYEKINQMVALNQMRLLNPRIALQELSWVTNVDEYLAGIQVLEDKQMAMVANGGNNATNRQRQRQARVDVAKIDNDVADLQGQGQNLVEPEDDQADIEEDTLEAEMAQK